MTSFVTRENIGALSLLWMCVGGAVAVLLQFVTAWYSRFYTGKTLLGFSLPGAIGWTLMESISLITLLVSYFFHGGDMAHMPIPLICWAVHYSYRSYIYPWTRFTKPLPGEVVLFASCFNIVNGTLNGASLAFFGSSRNPVLLGVGVLCWALGFIGNVHSDEVVRRLRHSPADRNTYKIPPPSGMHRFLASPNYSCETFEWFGLWVATGFRNAMLSFAVWSVCNLAPHAVANRKWYINKFGDAYPKDRKVFIPFIW